MKQYRAKKKLDKGKQEKGANTLMCAWKAQQVRKELKHLRAKNAQDQINDTNPIKRT